MDTAKKINLVVKIKFWILPIIAILGIWKCNLITLAVILVVYDLLSSFIGDLICKQLIHSYIWNHNGEFPYFIYDDIKDRSYADELKKYMRQEYDKKQEYDENEETRKKNEGNDIKETIQNTNKKDLEEFDDVSQMFISVIEKSTLKKEIRKDLLKKTETLVDTVHKYSYKMGSYFIEYRLRTNELIRIFDKYEASTTKDSYTEQILDLSKKYVSYIDSLITTIQNDEKMSLECSINMLMKELE